MNIGLDAKRLFLNFTGLGNYSRYILDSLLKYRPANDHFYLYTPKCKPNNNTAHYFGHPAIDIIQPSGFMKLPLINGIWRSSTVVKDPSFAKLDVYHGLSNELPINIPIKIKKFVTVHDLIFLRYPEFYSAIDVRTYQYKVKSACMRADKIMAISEQTAKDIIEFLDIPSEKISIVYQGCHDQFRVPADDESKKAIRLKYNLPNSYILNVSTIEERKNAAGLISAFALVPKELRIPLVIVGRSTAYMKKVKAAIERHGLETEIIFIHAVAFYELPAIYQMASAFIYPSLFEGFGIPLLEASESGIPIITSIGSCFGEAAGPGAMYVDPLNAGELGEAISTLLSTDNSERIAQQKGHVKQFLPEYTNRAVHDFYTS